MTMGIALDAGQIIVTLSGALLVVGIIWFFFGKKEKAVVVSRSVKIVVDGGYSPETIIIPKGQPTELIFERRDPNACLEELVFPDFGIRKFLPLNQPVTIELKPERSGEFRYSCGMHMFHGRIVVT